MSIVSRIIIALFLVLSIIALALGIKLFNQREEIKGRTQKLEGGIIKLAANIESMTSSNLTDKNLPTVVVKSDDLKKFYKYDDTGKPIIDPATKQKITSGSNTLDAVLKDLEGLSAVQLNRLNDTRDTLKQTQETLAKTEETLRQTIAQLDNATNQIAQLNATLEERNKTIQDQKDNIAQLTEAKDRAEQKIQEQTEEIAKLKDTKQDLQTQISALKRRIDDQDKLITELKQPDRGLIPGLQGQIMVVNSNFNFVVLDLPPKTRLTPGVDLLVQRKDKMVGKIQITEVKENERFAIADILTEWQQIPYAIGDNVFR